MKIFRTTQAALLVACLGLTQIPTVQAQSTLDETEKAFKQGTKRILQALDALMMSIPQYGAPEIMENGDIIIRRKHRERSEPRPASPDKDETAT